MKEHCKKCRRSNGGQDPCILNFGTWNNVLNMATRWNFEVISQNFHVSGI